MPSMQPLISDDFFPASMQLDLSNIFPVAVVATMSSGKSTLINALLGRDILPNSNAACTTKAVSILDDDQPSREVICATNLDGATKVIYQNIEAELARLNNDPTVQNIFIRSHVRGILNTGKALLLIDTPGPNNSQDDSHKGAMIHLMDQLSGGLILYVLNAEELGTKDDKTLLSFVRTCLKKKLALRVVFVLNKIDALDMEKESVKDFIFSAKDFIETCGFQKPDILPVSSMAAVLFQKVISRRSLTRKERRYFNIFYELYQPSDLNMTRYAIISDLPGQFEEIEVDGKIISVGQLRQALHNTGINLIETYIQRAQILSDLRIKNTIKVRHTG